MGSGSTADSREERRRRKRRRQALTFSALFLVVTLTAVGALGNWLEWWSFGSPQARQPCPAQTVSAANQTSVNVLNVSSRRGLAAAVAKELRQRRFKVLDIGNEELDGTAPAISVRFSTGDKVRARTVARQFPGKVPLVADPRMRADDSVDVLIGEGYEQMRPRDEALAAIAPAPTPRGCLPEADGN